MATSEKPKKMRRRWPLGSGTHVAAVAVVSAAVILDAVAPAPGTSALKMPLGWRRPAASVEPSTTSCLLVYCRPPDWSNSTLARSTAGQESPLPMVSPTILRVAEAPLRGGVTLPAASR